ncbi:MAG TPA: hypothetical protein VLH79_10680 [Chthonomonadales bacterium]|nr:hypothetical protein [Chthonomonadales bacterium]
MEPLREYLSLRREEGYVLDSWHDADSLLRFLDVWLSFPRRLVSLLLAPLFSRMMGDRRRRRLERIQRQFPRSLVCPECEHVLCVGGIVTTRSHRGR